MELYDILIAPEQRHDIATAHPDVVAELRKHYEAWWELVSPRFDEECPIVLGTENEKIAVLTSHDWHGEAHAWNQGQIRQGLECNGYWAIEIAEAGEYAFELRRWPKAEDKPMTAGIPGETIDWYHGGQALNLKTARIRVGTQEATQPIPPDAKGVTFTFRLKPGQTRLHTFLTDNEGVSIGAYYVYVRRVGMFQIF
ncbi:hypothetical protein HYR99_20410 [Candidatus Poribacteria bacterium]|nr:hypothetical protein [Candidatus Poribacteria bacterium]